MAERRSLLTAFLVLQDSGAPLEFGTWRELIRKIRPAASDTEAKVLFDFLDVDHHGGITIHEFLRLIEVLSFQVRARIRQRFIKVERVHAVATHSGVTARLPSGILCDHPGGDHIAE